MTTHGIAAAHFGTPRTRRVVLEPVQRLGRSGWIATVYPDRGPTREIGPYASMWEAAQAVSVVDPR